MPYQYLMQFSLYSLIKKDGNISQSFSIMKLTENRIMAQL